MSGRPLMDSLPILPCPPAYLPSRPELFDQDSPPVEFDGVIVASGGLCAPLEMRPRPFDQDAE